MKKIFKQMEIGIKMTKYRNMSIAILFPVFLIMVFNGCQQNQQTTGKVYTDWVVSDSLITDAVEDELKAFPEVPAHLIDVVTNDGIVKLTGSTDNLLAREKATEIASAIKGVNGVVNDIEVIVPDVPENELKEEIESMLYYDPVVERYDFDIEVNDGNVVLSGIVDSWSEKQLTENIVKSIRGIKNIENKIVFEYDDQRSDDDIEADIEGYLKFDVHVDHALIDVEVEDGIAVISGTVGSLSEKSKAINDAMVVGVDSVNAENLAIEKWARDPLMRKDKYSEKKDDEIKAALHKSLMYDARVNDLSVDINVRDGYVTLRGSVSNLRAKNAAGEDANNIVGVWGVENRLKVRPVKPKMKKAVADNTRIALKLNPYLQQSNIEATEVNGKIYLTGHVNTYFERQKAEEIVSGMPGVVEVRNNIKVNDFTVYPYTYGYYAPSTSFITKPDIEKTDQEIKEDIEKNLWWSPFVNENEVHVDVDDGHVTLSGTVDTKLERKYAQKSAVKADAFTVENNLLVEFGP